MSGKQLNLDPTLLFLWLSYWGWAWGILGLILAYPMLADLRIGLEHIAAKNAERFAHPSTLRSSDCHFCHIRS
jgi:predicted PurR-regulated permease PerM